MCVVLIFFFSR